MTDSERLIELLSKINFKAPPYEIKTEDIADYLLANGVIVPPCKVGDTVWYLIEDDIPEHRWYLSEEKVEGVSSEGLYVNELQDGTGCFYFDSYSEIGKTIFLTKEEAEEKLKELSNAK